MKNIPHLSRRLTEFRTRFGLTQEAFAEKTGFDYKFYQTIEAGRKKQVWLETIERLAAAYGLEAWELLAPAEPAVVKSPRLVKYGIKKSDADRPARKPGRPSGRIVAGDSKSIRYPAHADATIGLVAESPLHRRPKPKKGRGAFQA